jgi:hypothetical protein
VSAALARLLFARVDIAPLVLARIVFGAMMVIEIIQFFVNDWVGRYYIEPSFLFTFPGFGWVRPLPGTGMYSLFAALGGLAAMMALGLYYRLAAIAFGIGITWVFLLDQTHYLNHMYLICLLAFMLAVVPAHRAASLDALRHESSEQTVPAWTLLLLKGQIAIVYIYGGIAKIDGDWLAGAPAAVFLRGWHITAPLATSELACRMFAVSGMLFDLFVVPALLWRRTRVLATLAALMFHLSNAGMFSIGIFPWLMLGTLPLFWPATASRWILSRIRLLPAAAPDLAAPSERPRHAPAITYALLAYASVQILLPLRHWLYPGEVNWTEEGHNFSWHMKLRIKHATLRYTATDRDTGDTWTIDPRTQLTKRQVDKMGNRPQMIRQYAVELARQYAESGQPHVEIRAHAISQLNAHPPQLIIDPNVDLAHEPFTLAPAPWIVPLGAAWARQGGSPPTDGE